MGESMGDEDKSMDYSMGDDMSMDYSMGDDISMDYSMGDDMSMDYSMDDDMSMGYSMGDTTGDGDGCTAYFWNVELECGRCQVLVHDSSIHPTCASFCEAQGRSCVVAHEEMDDNCRIEDSLGHLSCDFDFVEYGTGDYLCTCSMGYEDDSMSMGEDTSMEETTMAASSEAPM